MAYQAMLHRSLHREHKLHLPADINQSRPSRSTNGTFAVYNTQVRSPGRVPGGPRPIRFRSVKRKVRLEEIAITKKYSPIVRIKCQNIYFQTHSRTAKSSFMDMLGDVLMCEIH
jgi:hypothetical protein